MEGSAMDKQKTFPHVITSAEVFQQDLMAAHIQHTNIGDTEWTFKLVEVENRFKTPLIIDDVKEPKHF